jgi:hypothetical protein
MGTKSEKQRLSGKYGLVSLPSPVGEILVQQQQKRMNVDVFCNLIIQSSGSFHPLGCILPRFQPFHPYRSLLSGITWDSVQYRMMAL